LNFKEFKSSNAGENKDSNKSINKIGSILTSNVALDVVKTKNWMKRVMKWKSIEDF
jgi:hypothetical protein